MAAAACLSLASASATAALRRRFFVLEVALGQRLAAVTADLRPVQPRQLLQGFAGLLPDGPRLRGLVGGLPLNLFRLLQARPDLFQLRFGLNTLRLDRLPRFPRRLAALDRLPQFVAPRRQPGQRRDRLRQDRQPLKRLPARATAAAGSSGRRFLSSRNRSRSFSCRSHSFSFSS